MARNDDRRRMLADAGLTVLATDGARGLTHRAVDRVAEVPLGTTSNYFRNRSALVTGLVERIGERLAPDEEFLAERSGVEPSRALFAEYLRDIERRLMQNRTVTLALFELRLEAVRRPEVAELLVPWRRQAFAGDVAFNAAAGLPGGERDIALFHYAVDGLLFDRLTGPLEPDVPPARIIDDLVDRLLPD
ncbi:MAG TPA: TetR/AcrR family transcriptional regulator [Candidatus Avipropionibacterium avicola]|uniref:TetR/AcrR family transcriptional regulator n=1 Tax=Candidatus Avipropionibacterium avicola TaxID=2840701 RepID=A0A9D1KNX0_9ACTN|nr:TetR/AcrR family transcriptional regulator [Candidatus Avipropionibacterium avicola]